MESNIENAEITQLRQERATARVKIDLATQVLEVVLNKLSLDTGNSTVTWEEFKNMEVGMLLTVNKDVTIVKYFESDSQMGFKSIMKAGGSFGIQSHDCIEEVLVLQGNLIETLRDNKVYTKGQTVTYLHSQLHKPYCTMDSIYKVVFTKNPHINDSVHTS